MLQRTWHSHERARHSPAAPGGTAPGARRLISRPIGILALQGAVEPHVTKLEALGERTVLVKLPSDLENLSGLILPGGESTTMLHLMALNELEISLTLFLKERPVWGVCAGAILLARDVGSPLQRSFGAIDMTVERNAFGRQQDSFIREVLPEGTALSFGPQEAVFIRAPRITRVSKECEVLYRLGGEPVMVRQQEHTLASTFHPELSESMTLHRFFVEMCHHG